MDDRDMKFVLYSKWCDKCKHQKVDETDDPCNECLTNPVNLNSRKPTMFEPTENK